MFHSLILATLLAAAPATHSAQQAAPRTGTWDLEITYGGGVLEGRLELSASGDSLAARLFVGEHSPPISAVKRNGNKLTLTGGGEGMSVVYELTFNGDTLTGTFTFNDADGTLTGRRRKA
jgi:hypothetical protein